MRIYGNINNYRSEGMSRIELLRKKYSGSSTKKQSSQGSSSLNKTRASFAAQYKKSTTATDTSIYDEIGTSAKNVNVHTDKLSNTNKSNLFDAKEPDKGKIVNEVKGFVEDYNSLVKQMKKSGSTTYKSLAQDLKSQAVTMESDLSTIGLTYKSDGTLVIDNKKLENADLKDLKKVFYGEKSFASVTTEKCSTIQKRTCIDKIVNASYNSNSKTDFNKSI